VGRVEFRAYLGYLTDEVSRVLTSKKVADNLGDFTFSSEEVSAYVASHIAELITEFQDTGELTEAPGEMDKYLFVGKPEE
jgi:hypothetical protein